MDRSSAAGPGRTRAGPECVGEPGRHAARRGDPGDRGRLHERIRSELGRSRGMNEVRPLDDAQTLGGARRIVGFVITAATKNWGTKILAFLLALMVFIVTREEITRSFTI